MKNLHRNERASWGLVALLALTAMPIFAMEAPVGMVDEPCPPPLAMPPEAAQLLTDLFIKPRTLQPADLAALGQNEQFAAYQKESRLRGANDWAGLCRFRHANAEVATAANRPKVVF